MIKKLPKIKKSKAFTLIEILVAVTIFSIVVLSVFAIFFYTNSFQAKTKVTRDVTQSARFFMEAVSREVRLAKKIQIGNPGQNNLEITDSEGGVKQYYLGDGNNAGKIMVKIKEPPTDQNQNPTFGRPQAVTTDDVNVQELTFVEPVPNCSCVKITVKIKQAQTTHIGEEGIVALFSVVYKRGYTQ